MTWMTIFRSDGVRVMANRKVKDDQLLGQDESERALGIARLVGQVETVVSESGVVQGFDAARWTAEWLDALQEWLKIRARVMEGVPDDEGLVCAGVGPMKPKSACASTARW